MTAALLDRPAATYGCPVPWCMNAYQCDHNDPNDGHLHFGRPSYINSFRGDDIRVQPFQFVDSASDTGPRVEVSAHDNNQSSVPLTPNEAHDFAEAIRRTIDGTNTGTTAIVATPICGGESCSVTVRRVNEALRISGYDCMLVELSFFDPRDSDLPVTVQAVSWDAVAYARYLDAAAVEVSR